MHYDSFKFVERRITRISDRFNVNTQRIRAGLILQLEALAEMANERAIDTHNLSIENKQNWTRLAAYISQVINGISKTFDEVQIDADLALLEKLVEEYREEEQNSAPGNTNK